MATRSGIRLGLPPGRSTTGLTGASGYQAGRLHVEHKLAYPQSTAVVLNHGINPAQVVGLAWRANVVLMRNGFGVVVVMLMVLGKRGGSQQQRECRNHEALAHGLGQVVFLGSCLQ